MKDALNNDIQIGELYGYARQVEGIDIVVTGYALEVFSNGTVRIQLKSKTTSTKLGRTAVAYKNEAVNVKGVYLFPVGWIAM